MARVISCGPAGPIFDRPLRGAKPRPGRHIDARTPKAVASSPPPAPAPIDSTPEAHAD